MITFFPGDTIIFILTKASGPINNQSHESSLSEINKTKIP
jgi:hypothetical protein